MSRNVTLQSTFRVLDAHRQFAKYITEHCQRHNFTQQQICDKVAELSGGTHTISTAHLSRISNAKADPTLSDVHWICAAIGQSLEEWRGLVLGAAATPKGDFALSKADLDYLKKALDFFGGKILYSSIPKIIALREANS